MRIAILGIMCLLSMPPPVIAQNNLTIDPRAEFIMNKAFEKARTDLKLKHDKIDYDIKTTEDFYDENGEVKHHKEEPFKTKKGDFKIAGMDLDILGLFSTRYQFRMSPENSLAYRNGKLYFVVEFLPKPNPPLDKTEDKFINRLQGKLYIDCEDYLIQELDASIPEEFNFDIRRFIFSATIHVKSFEMSMIQTEFGGISIEKSLHAEVSAVATFISIEISNERRVYDYEFGNYRFK